MDTELTPIAERLATIESRLEQVVHAIDQANQREREQGDKTIAVAAIIRQPEAIERENTTNQHKAQRTQNIIAIAAWAAFIAALSYAVIARLTLDKVSEQTAQIYHQGDVENANASKEDAQAFRQLQALRDQAKASQDNVQAIQKQMRIDQRPWIYVIPQGEFDYTNLSLPLVALNVGKTSAKNVIFRAVVKVVENGQQALSGKRNQKLIDTAVYGGEWGCVPL